MNTEFMLTIPVDYLIVFAVILACVLGALAACVVMLNSYQKQLEEIFKAVTAILYTVDKRYEEIRKMSEKIGDMHNDLNVCHDKLDMIMGSLQPSDEENDTECRNNEFTIKIESEAFDELVEAVEKIKEDEWPEPGEVVELEERDVKEPTGDRFIDDFLAGKYDDKLDRMDEVVKKASETTMSMTEAAASFSEYDVDDVEPVLKDKEDGPVEIEIKVKNISDADIEQIESGLGIKLETESEEGPGWCADELDIHMISRDEYLFGEIHEYGKFRLWYDTVKDVLRCSTGLFNSEEFEPTTATFLGDGLRFFGVSSQNKNVIYIRNHKLKADFMVEKASVT